MSRQPRRFHRWCFENYKLHWSKLWVEVVYDVIRGRQPIRVVRNANCVLYYKHTNPVCVCFGSTWHLSLAVVWRISNTNIAIKIIIIPNFLIVLCPCIHYPTSSYPPYLAKTWLIVCTSFTHVCLGHLKILTIGSQADYTWTWNQKLSYEVEKSIHLKFFKGI